MIFNSVLSYLKTNLSSFISSNLQSLVASNLPSIFSSNKLLLFILTYAILFIQNKLNSKPYSFTINLYNVPTSTQPTSSNKLNLYLAIVKLIKLKYNCSSLPFIADFNGKFNYISTTSNVALSNYILLNSTLTYNDDISFNPSITISSPSLSKLKLFIHKAYKLKNM
jgi:hypothetical protein